MTLILILFFKILTQGYVYWFLREWKGERETSISCLLYASWLGIQPFGVWGQCSNSLSCLARAKFSNFCYLKTFCCCPSLLEILEKTKKPQDASWYKGNIGVEKSDLSLYKLQKTKSPVLVSSYLSNEELDWFLRSLQFWKVWYWY